MTPLSSPMLATGTLAQSHGTDREKLAGAAKQFEAIFVRQMLAAARKTDFGGSLLGGEAIKTFNTMQDEHFADLAADTGAFGLAKMIEKQLAAQLDADGSGGASTGSARAGIGISPKPIQLSPAQPLPIQPFPAQPEPVEGAAQPVPAGKV